jgi:hypothetical protein
MLMVHQDTSFKIDDAVSLNFSKKSIINGLLGDTLRHQRPPHYVYEIIPGTPEYIDTVPPSLLSIATERNASILETPILIDMGIEAPDYKEQERAFLKGNQS